MKLTWLMNLEAAKFTMDVDRSLHGLQMQYVTRCKVRYGKLSYF